MSRAMKKFVERRKRSGMSQFLCAQRAGISRMRLSLAETGQIELSEQEEKALRLVLNEYISAKAREVAMLSQEQRESAGSE
jgi:transcriptional regulator with XRE-family HTH domain